MGRCHLRRVHLIRIVGITLTGGNKNKTKNDAERSGLVSGGKTNFFSIVPRCGELPLFPDILFGVPVGGIGGARTPPNRDVTSDIR